MDVNINDIISLCKRRGFIYPGSEIYGGLANTWDYGHLGVELKNNIKQAWWQYFIRSRDDMIGLDASILMNPRVWEASGHVGGFSDPLMDCKNCKTRHRADKLIEEKLHSSGIQDKIEGLDFKTLRDKVDEYQIKCPACGKAEFTEIRSFNLMFKTHQGVTDESSNLVYLRPETAQGIFVNFRNAQTASRKKIPFGIGQIGKAFRNEITPGNFIFRTREFEQMEIEYFCHPDESLKLHGVWKQECMDWLAEMGFKPELYRARDHEKEELSHYSQATTDIEFKFPFGWGELWGIAHRGCYDLTKHMEFSGKDLHYSEPDKNLKFIPHVIEPSLGTDRFLLALLCNAYEKEDVEGDERIILRLHPRLAPVKVAVMPLSKKLEQGASEVKKKLVKSFNVDYDDSGSIGKRYRRQDEAGTPLCVTYDFDSESDEKVTVRDRDTMNHERISIDLLEQYIFKKVF